MKTRFFLLRTYKKSTNQKIN